MPPVLRMAMENAFGASDADGGWDWKTAYDACEAATVLFLRKFGPAMRSRAASPAAMLPMLAKIAGLLPTHTRRSEESEALQQFSTPILLGLAASAAAAITPDDIVLEPSAGTGLLAILAELSGGSLVLNELAETRAELLSLLFPGIAVTRFDAAHIDDHLDAGITPSVVLMNPPFSAIANVDRRMADAALRHIASALARLPEGGRLVAITGASCSPDNPVWTDAFIRMQEHGRVVFSAAMAGAVFAKHGTTIETRLTVIDRLPADDPTAFPSSPGVAPDVATLLGWVTEHVPSRLPIATAVAAPPIARPAIPRTVRAYRYAPVRHRGSRHRIPKRLNSPMRPSHGHRPKAAGSPRRFTKNTHFSRSVFPALSHIPPSWYNQPLWRPSRRRSLPIGRTFRQMSSRAACCPTLNLSPSFMRARRILSSLRDHGLLTRLMTSSAPRATMRTNAVRFRRGWFLGDGTGAGKGRQVAGILLDNWLKGRRRAVWVSKSDKLIEDAQRDWSALGMERLLVTPLSRFRQGTPIRLEQGVLFTTYATLRSDARDEKVSRVKQIVEWLGADFDGVIIFDESHAMQNAAGGKGERGDQAASQQGRAGLRLQHALPNARIVYVSATGATTVHNLAYAQRLGFVGRRGLSVRDAQRVRRGDRGRRRRGNGSARPRYEGAWPLCGPLPFL